MNVETMVVKFGNMPSSTVRPANTICGISMVLGTSHFSPASKSRPGKKAAAKIDWTKLGGPDARKGGFSCCDPADVPPVASASFLAAAARACDDPATADRLEAILAPRLVRRNGEIYLDVGREWRVGSTANWIISRAEANGARFRTLLGE